MSVFNKYNKGSNFDFQTPSDFEFVKLEDLYEVDGDNQHDLKALFINTKSKFGDSPVAVTDKALVNLPGHLLDTVREMINDDEVVNEINSDRAGIEIYEYESKKWGTNYSVNFIEKLPF